MNRPLRVAHLFPELLNLYADRGNLAVLRARAVVRGIDLEVVPIRLGEPLNLAELDMVLLGGGSDKEQMQVASMLPQYQSDLHYAVEAGMPMLAVCGGYQLLGDYYETLGGDLVKGLRLVEMYTKAEPGTRLVGNIAIECSSIPGVVRQTVVGFENHQGRTYHPYLPLGKVLSGYGNNGRDGLEGLHHLGVIGTYIHGPLLPKNPHLADYLLTKARAFRGVQEPLVELDDTLEWRAHEHVLQMLGISKTTPAETSQPSESLA
ncbi:MAG: glutamine amidotransferase [Firmicutes bacterium]|nr:glutamine amidotransferase [Bacillota bacterium]